MAIHITRATSAEELAACKAIRHEVFVVGQNVPVAIESDEYDAGACHLLARLDGTPVGTVRWVLKDGNAKIGRLAVLDAARGNGIGKMLIALIEKEIAKAGQAKAVMSAQSYLKAFYEEMGFVAQGEEYMEADIPHVWMEKNLSKEMAA